MVHASAKGTIGVTQGIRSTISESIYKLLPSLYFETSSEPPWHWLFDFPCDELDWFSETLSFFLRSGNTWLCGSPEMGGRSWLGRKPRTPEKEIKQPVVTRSVR